MATLLESIGFGLVTAAIIALAAMALSLQFGVTNIPNFAHGEIITFGAFGALWAQLVTNNLIIDAIVGMAIAGGLAFAINRFILQSFIRIGTRPIYLLVVTAGLSLVLQNGLTFFVGGGTQVLELPADAAHPYHVGPFIWTQSDIVVMLAALVVIAALYALLQFTRFGKAQRAVADTPELARVSGIDVYRVVNVTWLLAGVVAGLAGVALEVTQGTAAPALGFNFLLVVFAAAILGGIGKPYGALAGAVIVGIATEVSAAYVNAAYKTTIAIAVLILALLVRPNGLFTSAREIL